MSLINDALKRASQSEKNRPRDAGLPPGMEPAPEARRSIVPTLMGVLIALLLAMAGWFFWQSMSQRDIAANRAYTDSTDERADSAEAPSGPAALTSIGATTNPGSAGVPPYRPEPAPSAVSTNVSGGAAAAADRPAVPPAAASTNVSAPPAFPEVKLQGIFYSRVNPRAVINGQIKGEKEIIGDVRIVTITASKVTVEWNGRTQDLILGGP
jgi:hypothetical protein